MSRLRTLRSIVSAMLLVSLTVAGCGDDGGADLVLTEQDSGTEIGLDAGEQFAVRLESNPTTGYSWEVSEMTTPDLVVLESVTHVETDTELVGAPGTDVFVFTAGSAGAGILRLEYVRSFEDPAVPERIVEFVLRIDDAPWPPPGGTPPSTGTAVAPD